MRNSFLFSMLILIFFAIGCNKSELKGKQSPQGEVGNYFTTGNMPGVENFSATVVDLTDGISTINVNADLTDPDLEALAQWLAALFPDQIQLSGANITAMVQVRITKDGIAGVYRDGAELIYCTYDAGVGTEYSTTTDGEYITSTVVTKTNMDDYPYGGLYIKTSEVQLNTDIMSDLGIEQLSLYFNHRFGFVGIFADLGVNGTQSLNVFSDREN